MRRRETFTTTTAPTSTAPKTLFHSRQNYRDGAKIFEKMDQVDAIDFIQESSKSEPSSRLLNHVLRGTHGISCSEHKEYPAWNTRNVLLGTQDMSCLEQSKCPAWSTRNVLLGTQGLSCLEHTESAAPLPKQGSGGRQPPSQNERANFNYVIVPRRRFKQKKILAKRLRTTSQS